MMMSSSVFEPQARDLAQSQYEPVHAFTFEESSSFGQCARELRSVFEERFESPRATASAERYFWDPWHVTHRPEDFTKKRQASDPESSSKSSRLARAVVEASLSSSPSEQGTPRGGSSGLTQYSMLRTPAAEYFSEELFEKLCVELTEFGRRQLGCDALTPPWLALYVDGHEMNWHTDSPHGPWAFVLSLTPTTYYAPVDGDDPGFFSGGETVLMRQERVLDYWRRFDASKGLECQDILDVRAPTPFGQLLCFDGRVPHRVSTVKGTKDPRRGRLVLTGWFSEPRTRAEGGLVAEDEEALRPDAKAILDTALDTALKASADLDLGRVLGFLALRLSIQKDGSVKNVDALVDTLIADPAEYDPSSTSPDPPPIGDNDDDVTAAFATARPDFALKILLRSALFEASFPTADTDSLITVPLSFT